MKLMRFHPSEVWGLGPFEQFTNLRAELDRAFGLAAGEFVRGEISQGWVPALDLREEKDTLVATVELPGLRKQDIDVSVHDGVLSIAGERSQERKADDPGCHRSERFHGRFHRKVTLPTPVRTEGVTATYKDGLLTVTLPKTEEARPKQIEVSVG